MENSRYSKTISFLTLDFQELKMAIGFPCQISLKLQSLNDSISTEMFNFDLKNQKVNFNGKSSLKAKIEMDEDITLTPIVHTSRGQKCGGKILLLWDQIIKDVKGNVSLPIKMCPDPAASLNLKYSLATTAINSFQFQTPETKKTSLSNRSIAKPKADNLRSESFQQIVSPSNRQLNRSSSAKMQLYGKVEKLPLLKRKRSTNKSVSRNIKEEVTLPSFELFGERPQESKGANIRKRICMSLLTKLNSKETQEFLLFWESVVEEMREEAQNISFQNSERKSHSRILVTDSPNKSASISNAALDIILKQKDEMLANEQIRSEALKCLIKDLTSPNGTMDTDINTRLSRLEQGLRNSYSKISVLKEEGMSWKLNRDLADVEKHRADILQRNCDSMKSQLSLLISERNQLTEEVYNLKIENEKDRNTLLDELNELKDVVKELLVEKNKFEDIQQIGSDSSFENHIQHLKLSSVMQEHDNKDNIINDLKDSIGILNYEKEVMAEEIDDYLNTINDKEILINDLNQKIEDFESRLKVINLKSLTEVEEIDHWREVSEGLGRELVNLKSGKNECMLFFNTLESKLNSKSFECNSINNSNGRILKFLVEYIQRSFKKKLKYIKTANIKHKNLFEKINLLNNYIKSLKSRLLEFSSEKRSNTISFLSRLEGSVESGTNVISKKLKFINNKLIEHISEKNKSIGVLVNKKSILSQENTKLKDQMDLILTKIKSISDDQVQVGDISNVVECNIERLKKLEEEHVKNKHQIEKLESEICESDVKLKEFEKKLMKSLEENAHLVNQNIQLIDFNASIKLEQEKSELSIGELNNQLSQRQKEIEDKSFKIESLSEVIEKYVSELSRSETAAKNTLEQILKIQKILNINPDVYEETLIHSEISSVQFTISENHLLSIKNATSLLVEDRTTLEEFKNKFKEKEIELNELNIKFNEANCNSIEKENYVSNLEKEVSSLMIENDSVNVKLKQIEIQIDILTKDNLDKVRLQSDLDSLIEILNNNKIFILELESKLKTENETNLVLNQELKELELKLRQQQEHFNTSNSSLSETQKHINEIEANLQLRTSELSSKETECIELTRQIDAEKKTIESTKSEVLSLSSIVSANEIRIKELEEMLVISNNDYLTLKNTNDILSVQITEKNDKIKLDEVREEELIAKLDRALIRNEELEKINLNLQTSISEYQKEIDKTNENLLKLNILMKDLEIKSETIQIDNKTLIESDENLKTEINELNNQTLLNQEIIKSINLDKLKLENLYNEECSNSNNYKITINQVELKVKKLQDDIIEINNLLADKDNEIDRLDTLKNEDQIKIKDLLYENKNKIDELFISKNKIEELEAEVLLGKTIIIKMENEIIVLRDFIKTTEDRLNEQASLMVQLNDRTKSESLRTQTINIISKIDYVKETSSVNSETVNRKINFLTIDNNTDCCHVYLKQHPSTNDNKIKLLNGDINQLVNTNTDLNLQIELINKHIEELEFNKNEKIQIIERLTSDCQTLNNEKSILQNKITYFDQNEKILKDNIDELKNQVDALKENGESIKMQNRDLEKTVSDISFKNKELEELLQNKSLQESNDVDLKKDLKNCEIKIQEYQNKIESLNLELEQKSNQIKSRTDEINLLKSQINDLQNENEDLSFKKMTLEDKLKSSENELLHFKTANSSLASQNKDSSEQIDALFYKLSTSDRALESLKATQVETEEAYKVRISDLNKKVEKIQLELKDSKNSIEILNKSIKDLERQISEYEQESVVYLSELESSKLQVEDLKSKLNKTQLEFLTQKSSLEVEIKSLKENNSNLEVELFDSKTTGKALKEKLDRLSLHSDSMSEDSTEYFGQLRTKVLELQSETDRLKEEKVLIEAKDSTLQREKEALVNETKSLKAQLSIELEKFTNFSLEHKSCVEGELYQNVEKNYVTYVQKIGEALSVIKSLKLKKTDQDKILGVLLDK